MKQIIITLHDNGEVTAAGPLADKVLFLGLCDIAKDLCLKYDPLKNPGIVLPQPGLN